MSPQSNNIRTAMGHSATDSEKAKEVVNLRKDVSDTVVDYTKKNPVGLMESIHAPRGVVNMNLPMTGNHASRRAANRRANRRANSRAGNQANPRAGNQVNSRAANQAQNGRNNQAQNGRNNQAQNGRNNQAQNGRNNLTPATRETTTGNYANTRVANQVNSRAANQANPRAANQVNFGAVNQVNNHAANQANPRASNQAQNGRINLTPATRETTTGNYANTRVANQAQNAANTAENVAAPRKAPIDKIIDATIRRKAHYVMEPTSTGLATKEDVALKKPLDDSMHAPKKAANVVKDVSAPAKVPLNQITLPKIPKTYYVMEPTSTGWATKEDTAPKMPLNDSMHAPKKAANEVKNEVKAVAAPAKVPLNQITLPKIPKTYYVMEPTSTGWATKEDTAPKKPLDDSMHALKNAANTVKNVAPTRKPGLDGSIYTVKDAPKEVSSFAPPPKATSNHNFHAPKDVSNTAKTLAPTPKKEVSSFAPPPKATSKVSVPAQNAPNKAENTIFNPREAEKTKPATLGANVQLPKNMTGGHRWPAPPPRETHLARKKRLEKERKDRQKAATQLRSQSVAPTLKKEVSSFAPPPKVISENSVHVQNASNKGKSTIFNSREAEKAKPATIGANIRLPKNMPESHKWPAPEPRETHLARKKRLAKERKNRRKAAKRLRSQSESLKSVCSKATSSTTTSPESVSSTTTIPESVSSKTTSPESVNSTTTRAESVSSTTTIPESVSSKTTSPESVNSTTTRAESVSSTTTIPESVSSTTASPKTTSPESVSSKNESPKAREYHKKRPAMDDVKIYTYQQCSIMASATGKFPTTSGAPADTHTPNPEAPPFEPAPNSSRGVATPTDFMAAWRAKNSAPLVPVPSIPPRCIVLKNVPSGASLLDVLCLVFGGSIESISSNNPNEVTVKFIKPEDCQKYYETVRHGICVAQHTIEVEQRVCEPMDEDTKKCISAGTTRVVQVDIPNHKTLQDLHDVANDLDVDHVMYHTEPNMPGRAYYFFCNLKSGWQMMVNLMGTEWLQCPATFFPDPCGVAQGFHSNTLASSFMAAACPEVVVPDEDEEL